VVLNYFDPALENNMGATMKDYLALQNRRNDCRQFMGFEEHCIIYGYLI
jgi:hypothetical protein